MRVTIELVKSLNPCKDRFDNFKDNNPDFDGSFSDFIKLDNISYYDKIWVSTRIFSNNQLARWSILCADSVQHLFNENYPESKAVSNLLAYLKTIEDFDSLTEDQKKEICRLRAAAYAAYASSYATHGARAANARAANASAEAALYAADAAASTPSGSYAPSAAAASAEATFYAADAADAIAFYAAVDYAANVTRERQKSLNLLLLASVVDMEDVNV